MRAAYAAYGDVDLIGEQQSLARKKDVVTPWFGEWQEVNGTAWQQALLGKTIAGRRFDMSRGQVDGAQEAELIGRGSSTAALRYVRCAGP